ncbi:MAG: hypothetical protein EOP93_05270 [Lysobacteraceae bacterium]|nr:MAG: hypothetical protein EOP93_05270 [Xanthomonadaceae bacterium]
MRLSPILLSVALLCASGQVLAAESRQMDADGSGTCPDSTTASNDATDETDVDAAATAARRTQKAKPAAAARGGSPGGNRSAAPRWHSFLPGMFR